MIDVRRSSPPSLRRVAATCGVLALCSVACAQDGRTPDSDLLRDRAGRQRLATAAPGRPGNDVPLIQPPMFECRPVRNDETADHSQYPVPPPPFSKADIYPCTRCHDKPDDYNTTPRTLILQHTNIKLNHGPRAQWCYDCHNPSDRDKLRLAGGRLISFDESYELCGQCHGEKLRDWRLGIHGRRTGCWNGQREYLLCVNCHNQHSPRFAPLEPRPRPKMPTEIKLADHGGAP